MTPGESGRVASLVAVICEDDECEVCRRLDKELTPCDSETIDRQAR